jgi:uncharacterized protein (DUF2249 family)
MTASNTLHSPLPSALPPVFDVREIPRPRRHDAIMAVFNQLAHGQTFELLNDHDPLGLFSRMQEAIPGAFTWDYVMRGPEEWRVAIGRVHAGGCCGSCG